MLIPSILPLWLCYGRWTRVSGIDRFRKEVAVAEQRLHQAQTELPGPLESLDEEGALRVQTVRSLVQGALLDLAASIAQVESPPSPSSSPVSTNVDQGLSLDDIVVTNSVSPKNTTSSKRTNCAQGDKVVVEGDAEVRVTFRQEKEQSDTP